MAAGKRKTPAGPGASVLRAIEAEIERGWPPGLTVLTGDDLYHLDRAQRRLVDALVASDASDFGLSVYGEQAVDLAAVVAAARSVGMFAERRVVLVRDLTALEGEPDALVDYASSPPPASFLIVRAPDLDRRRKLHQALAKSGRLLEFKVPSGWAGAAALGSEVETLAREHGLRLEREAATLLVQICGGDFYRVDTELQKIGLWLGQESEQPVGVDVLREVASGSAALSGWEVAGALLRRDRRAALSALEGLLAAGEEPLLVLGSTAFRARSMLQARGLIDGGMAPAQAVRTARLFGEDPSKAARYLAGYSTDELLRFPSLLLEADRTLKSRTLAPRAVLGTLLERMMPETRQGGGGRA